MIGHFRGILDAAQLTGLKHSPRVHSNSIKLPKNDAYSLRARQLFTALQDAYNPVMRASRRWTDEDMPTIAAAASYLESTDKRDLNVVDGQVDAYLFQYTVGMAAIAAEHDMRSRVRSMTEDSIREEHE